MKFTRILALVLCVLLLVAVPACKSKADPLPQRPTDLEPALQDATNSVFVGTWRVSAKTSQITGLEFHADGSMITRQGSSQLGGSFVDDGSTITMTVSQNVSKGTYTVTDGVITILIGDDVWVLNKIA